MRNKTLSKKFKRGNVFNNYHWKAIGGTRLDLCMSAVKDIWDIPPTVSVIELTASTKKPDHEEYFVMRQRSFASGWLSIVSWSGIVEIGDRPLKSGRSLIKITSYQDDYLANHFEEYNTVYITCQYEVDE